MTRLRQGLGQKLRDSVKLYCKVSDARLLLQAGVILGRDSHTEKQFSYG